MYCETLVAKEKGEADWSTTDMMTAPDRVLVAESQLTTSSGSMRPNACWYTTTPSFMSRSSNPGTGVCTFCPRRAPFEIEVTSEKSYLS